MGLAARPPPAFPFASSRCYVPVYLVEALYHLPHDPMINRIRGDPRAATVVLALATHIVLSREVYGEPRSIVRRQEGDENFQRAK